MTGCVLACRPTSARGRRQHSASTSTGIRQYNYPSEGTMSNVYVNRQSSTGTCTLTAAAAPGATWSLTSLSVSMAGPASGLNAKLTIYDGTVAAGTVLFACFLN